MIKLEAKQNQSVSSITEIVSFLGEISHCDNNKKKPLQQFKGFSEKKYGTFLSSQYEDF
jgi:hypothetical protein